MEEFEYSWDFGEVSKAKEEIAKLKDRVLLLDKELELRHRWVKHHQKVVELNCTKIALAELKFDNAVEELKAYNPRRAEQLKSYK